jgi:hypothetical protein
VLVDDETFLGESHTVLSSLAVDVVEAIRLGHLEVMVERLCIRKEASPFFSVFLFSFLSLAVDVVEAIRLEPFEGRLERLCIRKEANPCFGVFLLSLGVLLPSLNVFLLSLPTAPTRKNRVKMLELHEGALLISFPWAAATNTCCNSLGIRSDSCAGLSSFVVVG